ncbi:MAG: nitrate ABC transporter permease [Actinomycetota bacterium]|nr:MAG: nitrate ABC transporter permease [Actinomycetota bacterium]
MSTVREAARMSGALRDAARSRSQVARLIRLAAPPLLVFLVVIGIWYAVTYLVLQPSRRFLLPPPHDVVRYGFMEPTTRAELWRGLLRSAHVAFLGLGVAFVIGFATAVLMSQAKWIERSLYPWAVVLQTVPILAIVPLLGFWFGFGLMSRVIVCVIIALFPIIINTLTGLLSADRRLHDLLTLHGAGRWTRLTKLQIPAALPDIFTGLRTSAGLAVIGAIVGDFFFGRGRPGLGLLLAQYSSRLKSEELLAAVLVACGFGVAVFSAFGWLGRRVVGAWDESWGATSRIEVQDEEATQGVQTDTSREGVGEPTGRGEAP